MTELKVVLNTVDKVKNFVQIIGEFPEDCDLLSGTYVIDAKSIMGVFSLDLSKPLLLRIHGENLDLSPLQEFMYRIS